MSETNLSRRTFVQTAAVGTVGTAVLATAGAAFANESVDAGQPSEGNAASDPAVTSSSAVKTVEGDTTYGTYLNPQQDAETYTTDYSALFSPLQIGSRTLANRIVKSAAGSETQTDSLWPSDTALRFYEQFAQGGVGMIDYESSNVLPTTEGGVGMAGVSESPDGEISAESGGEISMISLDLSTDDGIAAHQAIADDLHQFGTVVIAQVFDMTMATGSASTHVYPSDLETSFSNGHMQTTEEVQAEIQAIIDVIERYHKAGFDGVELNASCNHYFSAYLSRYINDERDDQYSGASLENRARVLTEIISGARERIQDDGFIIQVLYSGVEECIDELGADNGCTTVEEACEFAKLFEAAGASSLHIRSEAYGHHCAGFMPDVLHINEHGDTGYGTVVDYGKHFCGAVDGSHDGYGGLIEVAAKIKEGVDIPVGVVGSMDPRMAPDLIDGAIRDGKIDFILVTRSLLADPQMPNKLREGRRDECAPCTHCMTCFVAPYDFGVPMYCRVNPAITRAYTEDMPEGYDPLPADEPKRVMVVGGGPAGMEAARIAAQRGHSVSLYEKSSELGGLMGLVARVKGTHEKVEAHKEWLVNQLDQYGVDVVTGQEVTAGLVEDESPDVVIVATGGACTLPDVPGIEDCNPLTFESMYAAQLAGEAVATGDRVAIIGAQFQACTLALDLVRQGKTVTMLNTGSKDSFFMNAPTWPRLMGKKWLLSKGMRLYSNCVLQQAEPGKLTFQTEYGTTDTLEFDTLIVAEPMVENRVLYDEVSPLCDEVYAVGDCYSPNTIANATARANIVARRAGSGTVQEETVQVEGDEVYTASAVGIGDVIVTLGISDGAIVDASVDTSNETAGIGRDLGEEFARQIVEQGAIDAVSGATVTSMAVQEALADCLAQAGLA